MARYIDLEELEKRINENIKPDTPEEKALIEWCKDECIRQGYAMPTADVVPRSEIIRWRLQLEAVLEEIPETKREVAMEIFEEIEDLLREWFDFFRQDNCIRESSAIIAALSQVSERKKKYTEGK